MSAPSRRERIDSHIFVSLGPTAFQAEALRRVGDLLRSLDGDSEIQTEPRLDLGRAELQPDFAVASSGDKLPRLVIEVQRESTDRYALGVKRMAYGRAGIKEYWFIDPVHGRLIVMRLEPGQPDYGWPPIELRHGDLIPDGGFGAGIEVSRALPPLVARYQATQGSSVAD